MDLVLPRLYAILDPSQTSGRSPAEVCEAWLDAGVRMIQYREKTASSLGFFEAARDLAERVHRRQGTFIVNDRADIAAAAGADGVHVGQEDLPAEQARRLIGQGGIVGFSTHTLAQVREADDWPVDYVAFGPVFETYSKENPDATVGLDGLREARKATSKALVAIGGITVENAAAVIQAGADAVAVISNLVATSDTRARASEFLRLLKQPARSAGG